MSVEPFGQSSDPEFTRDLTSDLTKSDEFPKSVFVAVFAAELAANCGNSYLEPVTELDPIEQAANDTRTIYAARYLLTGVESGGIANRYDFGAKLAEVAPEYGLTERETLTALEIAEERELYGRH